MRTWAVAGDVDTIVGTRGLTEPWDPETYKKEVDECVEAAST